MPLELELNMTAVYIDGEFAWTSRKSADDFVGSVAVLTWYGVAAVIYRNEIFPVDMAFLVTLGETVRS